MTRRNCTIHYFIITRNAMFILNITLHVCLKLLFLNHLSIHTKFPVIFAIVD